jgi:UDP-glucuronate 4-epimerase
LLSFKNNQINFSGDKNVDLKIEKVLVTGSAGFIGFHLAKKLLENGVAVTGIDNINPYYDPSLKEDRLARLTPYPAYDHVSLDLADRQGIADLFSANSYDAVVNLAAQAGVRYSLENPHSYVDTNIVGFVNLLEGCRHSGVKHFVFASSSSVYGANTNMPFSVHHNVDHPVSLYAASKKSNELMAHTYSHLFGLAATGLRFFTVYGPWGRPVILMILLRGYTGSFSIHLKEIRIGTAMILTRQRVLILIGYTISAITRRLT